MRRPYGGAPPYQRTSRTSRLAAQVLQKDGKALSIRESVRRWLISRGSEGATREEIALGMGLRLQTVCGRVAELLQTKDDAGKALWAYELGPLCDRATTSGRLAAVVVAVVPEEPPVQLVLAVDAKGEAR